MSRVHLTALASRVMLGALVLVGGILALVLILGIVLWEADLHALRNKLEQARLALFGEWSEELWCPPGREAAECEKVDEFEAALEAASDFTFFKTKTIDLTGHKIHTGVRFATARDVVEGRPVSKWCYVVVSATGFRRQIELATQSAEDPPVYASLASLNEGALDGSGLSKDVLTRVARSHCQFDD